MIDPKYSVIVPVYNRPIEITELLESLLLQTVRDFEVIVVEDGSTIKCEEIVRRFSDKLSITYLYKPNSGPGPSRNEGFQQANGKYFVAFDSDCILPPTYFEAVERGLAEQKLDAWGGPDRAHENFTLIQRAMGYTMSSVLTTGGIRGGKKRVGWFQPRSFNMGISREVFEKTGGFHFDRFAEDIEFSIRMRNSGFRVGLIPDAFVYHKRRTTFGQFFRQVFNFGKGRILVGRKYPEEVKLTHWVPSLFLMATAIMVLLPLVSVTLFSMAASCFIAYITALFFHSWFVNRDVRVALLSIPSALLQFYGYGLGFLTTKFK